MFDSAYSMHMQHHCHPHRQQLSVHLWYLIITFELKNFFPKSFKEQLFQDYCICKQISKMLLLKEWYICISKMNPKSIIAINETKKMISYSNRQRQLWIPQQLITLITQLNIIECSNNNKKIFSCGVALILMVPGTCKSF